MPVTLDAVPIELVSKEDPTPSAGQPPTTDTPPENGKSTEQQIAAYVVNWRNQLKKQRVDKRAIWDECWQLYRGLEDFSNKEEWQSKIVLPKAFGSVKQATNVIKRLLSMAKQPWQVESVNPEDMIQTLRAEQMTDLTKVLLEQARYQEEFAEGLECGFIIGVGVWKVWWGLIPRIRTRVEQVQVPMILPSQSQPGLPSQGGGEDNRLLTGEVPPGPAGTGIAGQLPTEFPQQDNQLYPTQLPGEALNPAGWGGEMASSVAPQQYMQTQRQIIREEILEGRLLIRAVDPYNFYWLPGSKMNRWAGTIEEIEMPRYQLLELAELGILDKDLVAKIRPMRIPEDQKRSRLRFSEPPQPTPGDDATGVVKITEFYGPLIIDGKLVEKFAHVLVANDTFCLLPGGYQQNQFWHRKPPYIGFSPLALPFRTEGVGLVEMVRKIDKGLSQLANLSMDTLMFRLLPVFEINAEAFDNPEDFDTGMVPGKMFRRNPTYQGEGIHPIEFQDISTGAVQVAAALDREHQEGSLVSEIQQAMPRYRGVQSAAEVETKNENQNSFFGSMATDIERQALEPMLHMAMDLILQFLDTSNDPRVASILGIGADVFKGLSREEVLEMVTGDYEVKATGITSQLQKAEMLQNLVQFMNLIGQNPEAWVPYINQDKLLQRILEAFRPAIHDIENIIADPETALARQQAASTEKVTPQMLTQMVEMIKMRDEQQKQELAAQQQQQQAAAAEQQQKAQWDHEEKLARIKASSKGPSNAQSD